MVDNCDNCKDTFIMKNETKARDNRLKNEIYLFAFLRSVAAVGYDELKVILAS